MPRVVIADSDDDDEDLGYSPPGSRSPPPANAVAARSSGPVSHSESTDPAFFQRVFDEQSDAARQIAEETAQARKIDDGEGDGDIGKDRGRDDSPMSTDPLQGDGTERGNRRMRGRTERTARSIKVSMGAREEDEVWDIPSSPEQPVQRGSKRRKLSNEDETEDMDLVELPSSQEVEIDATVPPPPTMPPPTLPIDRSSFVVAPKPISSSRRKEYQIFPADSEDEPSQDQGPSRPAPGGIAISSGSATNINTPRSDPVASRILSDDLPQETFTGPQDTEVIAKPWGSSPDEIAHAELTPAHARKSKRKSQDSQPSDPLPANDEGEPDANYLPAEAHAPDDDGDQHSDFVEQQPVKPKKKRGRPRKNAVPDEASRGGTSPSTSHAAGGRSDAKPKKKRGRPRKSDQQAVEAEVPNDTSAKTSEDTTRDRVISEGDGDSKATVTRMGEKAEDEQDATHDRDAASGADETRFATTLDAEPNAVPDTAVRTEDDAIKQETPEQKRDAKVTSEPVKPKTPGSLAGLSTASRPLYRVGLSKRSRIAPLLKTVRKE